jgi:hypothetical protein
VQTQKIFLSFCVCLDEGKYSSNRKKEEKKIFRVQVLAAVVSAAALTCPGKEHGRL